MQSLSHPEFLSLSRFRAIDGLRAIAASLVICFHFGGSSWRWLSGWSGVQIFFVLSGFLITTLLLREEQRHGDVSMRGFYLRRAFRILPAYLVVVAVTYALAHVRGQDDLIKQTAPYYLSLLNEFKPSSLFLHSWTIGIEQKFYLIWPLLLAGGLAATFARRVWLTIALIVGLMPLLLVITQWPYWPVQYASILVGCLLAIIMHNPRSYAVVRPLTHPIVATAVVVGFACVQLALPRILAITTTVLPQSGGLLYALAVAALLPALLSTGPVSRLLATSPFAFVGDRSYSLYLVQVIAGTAVISTMPSLRHSPTLRMVVVFVVALLIADLIYRWVEAPMIEVGRRLARRTRPAFPVVPAPRPVSVLEGGSSTARVVPDAVPR